MFKTIICHILVILTCSICNISFAKKIDLQVVTELSPPYQIMHNNQVAGSSTDKVRKLLKDANISSSFNMYPWARAYEKALKEDNTLIYSIGRTAGRENLFHWLTPVTSYKFGLVAKSNRADLFHVSLDQLNNYLVAVQRLDISHDWVVNQGLQENTHFIVSPDIESSWNLLLKGKVDFIIESPELMINMLNNYNLPENTTRYVTPIPELALVGFLAANKNIDSKILQKLKAALLPTQSSTQ